MLAPLLVQLLSGLATASSLFLVAAGLTVIFGVTRVVNFAHGSLTMLGAFLGWSILFRLAPLTPLSFAAGILAAAALTAVIGIVIETTLLRRIYHAPELLQLLATFGIVLIVEDLSLVLWGPNDLSLARPRWLRAAIDLMDERVPIYDLVLIGIGPLVFAILWLLFNRTRWGTLVRAATQDRDMLSALGVDQRLLFTSVFALGAGLAGLGGALSLPDASANLQIDISSVTDAFVVVVVGGLGSIAGAYLASLLIGILQAFGIVFLPKITLVLAFAVMAIVLVLRPNGLLGRPQSAAAVTSTAPLVRPAPRALKLLALLILAAAIAAPFVAPPFLLSVLTEIAIAMLFAASLHFMMGPGGMPSFGHAAWFGLGAYASAWMAKGFLLSMPLGLLAAPIAAGLVAALFGAFVVRLSGVYLAMLTLAFAQIVWALVFQLASITGGDNGVLGVWPAAWAADPKTFYALTLALTVSGMLLLRRMLYAPFGYALRGTRDSPLRAEAIGLDSNRIRLVAFTVAGTAAGLAGGLTAYSKGSVFPGFIAISRSVDALLMVLLGGVQTIAGPVVGAIAYTGLFDWLLLATDKWRLCLGVFILVLVLVFPQGIAGTANRLWAGRRPGNQS